MQLKYPVVPRPWARFGELGGVPMTFGWTTSNSASSPSAPANESRKFFGTAVIFVKRHLMSKHAVKKKNQFMRPCKKKETEELYPRPPASGISEEVERQRSRSVEPPWRVCPGHGEDD